MNKNTVSCIISLGWQSLLVECTIETMQAIQAAKVLDHSHYDEDGNVVRYVVGKSASVGLLGSDQVISKEAHERIMEDRRKAKEKEEAEERQRNAEPAE